MRKFRGIIYRLGFRPKLGSIFHSPSLSLIYGMREIDVSSAFAQSINKQQTLQKQIKENHNG